MAILTGKRCTTALLGTGGEVCDIIEGQPVGFIGVPKSWRLNKATDVLNYSYVMAQIQQGIFVPFIGAFKGTPETPDAQRETAPNGTESIVTLGLTKYMFTYKKNLSFQKSAWSHNSTGLYDFLIIYDSGVIKVCETPDGTQIKGFDGVYLQTKAWKENDGSTSAETVIEFQLSSAQEINQYATYLSSLDFIPNQIAGVSDVKIVLTQGSTLSKLVAKVSWLHNEQFPIAGMASTNFKAYKADVANVITGVVENPIGTYEITVTTAYADAELAKVETYDSTATPPVAVAKIGQKFYKGLSNVLTIVD